MQTTRHSRWRGSGDASAGFVRGESARAEAAAVTGAAAGATGAADALLQNFLGEFGRGRRGAAPPRALRAAAVAPPHRGALGGTAAPLGHGAGVAAGVARREDEPAALAGGGAGGVVVGTNSRLAAAARMAEMAIDADAAAAARTAAKYGR